MADIAAIVLAAGRAARFREHSPLPTKLVAQYHGEPMVRHVVRTALACGAGSVLVVTGHAQAEVRSALAGLPVVMVHNADFASGMAGSLQRGMAAVPPTCIGALVMLGDMPKVRAETCAALIAALASAPPETKAVVPSYQGVQGNPVLLARAMFGAIADLEGDQGARKLLACHSATVLQIEVADDGVVADADTPQALADMH